jgi:hypothetical protein
MTTPAIPVTEFVLPDGRERPGSFKRSEEITASAYEIIGAGYRFTIERLTTGEISMAVEGDEGDEDVETVPNAPDVVGEGFDRLVTRFAASLSSAGA